MLVMRSNESNSTDVNTLLPPLHYEDDDDFNYTPGVIYIYYASGIFFTVVGTLLNLWFLVAILRSRDMRSCLRNKIICNCLVLHLVDSALLIPVGVGFTLSDHYYGCVVHSVFDNLGLIQEFISNWLLVMLIVVFIAQIQDFNPRTRLTPRAVTLGTFVLLVFPWVASLVVVPVVVDQQYRKLKWTPKGCLYPTKDAIKIFKTVDTAVPILLAGVLLIVAAVMKYRRFTHGFSSRHMQIELISRGPEMDNIFAYVIAVVVSTFCDLLRLIFSLDRQVFDHYSHWTWVNIVYAAWIMSESRVVLMPLPWLLLTDIRQRMRNWRPWHRPAVEFDLTVTYIKQEE